jgi:hypothetical protein
MRAGDRAGVGAEIEARLVEQAGADLVVDDVDGIDRLGTELETEAGLAGVEERRDAPAAVGRRTRAMP